MKKVTAFILILLANIILLAHAVLPHHHHKLQFCTEVSHCNHHSNRNPWDTTHEHDGEEGSDCILKQLIIFPSNQVKQECNCTTSNDHHFTHEGWLAVEIYQSIQPRVVRLVTKIEIPLSTLPYAYLTSSPAGLRAPPVV